MYVDVTSDLHLDFWVDCRHPSAKQQKLIKAFVNALLPENPSKVLLIAGDIGHYNWQNELMFKELRNTYDKIFWVSGNHDLYMISKNMTGEFERNSFNRLADMVERTNNIEGVHYLDGTVFDVDGVKIGGCGMWYDDTYASEKHFISKNGCHSLWLDTMNDANLIYNPDDECERIKWREYSEQQKAKMDLIYAQCDIVMSHVAPTWEHFTSYRDVPESTFYQFDGKKYLANMLGKIWLFGHTHDKYFFTHSDGCIMVCNPLGYPAGTSFDDGIMKHRKFASIDVGNIPTYEQLFGTQQ